ncbi:NACHT domain-containing protein [Chryseolinea sp. T2]|uniref:NACHT domain-containing protein n=1 Tax=Chryseolinea sp. T2 TaxID=3129255 RepID=UPI0030788F13
MIKELLIKEGAKTILALALNQVKKIGSKLISSGNDIEVALFNHVTEVKNWAGEITFKDLRAAKNIQEIYIDLDFYLFPRRNRITENEEIGQIPIRNIFQHAPKHVAILGQPGAGKTTSMKHFCRSVLLDETFYPAEFHFPILIKLRDVNSNPRNADTKAILIDDFFSILGLNIADSDRLNSDAIHQIKERLVVDTFNRIPCLIIIEGFDEVVFKKDRNTIIGELGKLANQIEKSRIIVTSRTADYAYSLENISPYEICPLTDSQISLFALKWLRDDDRANRFLEAVRKSPFHDTTIRPLTIAHLCAIYERVGKIPDKPKTVYKKIITLLLEEWDEQRNIKRVSQYSSFEVDRKLEFLSALAYHLTVKTQQTTFTKIDLENIYKKICHDFDLSVTEERSVANEIESHTGLFIESTYETYEFAHKSLQEYLTADYIVKLPSIPIQKALIERLPNEMAIAIAISSNPSEYFSEFIASILDIKFSFHFIRSFINRVLLEKPEFNRNSKVGFMAICLYSKYVFSNFQKSQLSLFVIDDLVKEFETFINTIYKRNASDEILKLYSVVKIVDSTSSSKILELSRKGISTRWGIMLPDTLYCRQNFIYFTSN